jgi:hypothetical protein
MPMSVRRIIFHRKFFEQLLFVFSIGLFVFAVGRIVLLTFESIDRHFSPGSLICDEPFYYFGVVMQGDHPEHLFTVNNVSNKPMTLQKVIPGCGSCVEILDYPHEPIPPQSVASIKAALLTDYLEGLSKKNILIKYRVKNRDHVLLVNLAATVEKRKNRE